MSGFIALISGVLFGIGLILSGMTNPDKILAFFDITGRWDPSLVLVMIGAIAVAFLPFQWAKKHRQSLLGVTVTLPTQTKVNPRVIVGSILFGIGFGLAGISPSSAMVNFTIHSNDIAWFVMAMLVGMCIFEWYDRWKLSTSLRSQQ